MPPLKTALVYVKCFYINIYKCITYVKNKLTLLSKIDKYKIIQTLNIFNKNIQIKKKQIKYVIILNRLDRRFIKTSI